MNHFLNWNNFSSYFPPDNRQRLQTKPNNVCADQQQINAALCSIRLLSCITCCSFILFIGDDDGPEIESKNA